MAGDDNRFDYIVVGGGSAGCLLANRLSADAACRVLLVEAGGRDTHPWIHIPVGYLYCIGNPRTDWLYTTESELGLNGRSLRYPRGKVLGGCSSINGMVYMRGQSRDYDRWADLTGDPTWRWDACLPFFKQHEDHWRGADSAHAAPGFDASGTRPGGEWRVERQRLRWDVLDAFAAAAQQAGIPATTDFNRGDNEGVGYFEVNQRRGVRWNTAKAFLRPALGRPNLVVWTNTQVARVLFDGAGSATQPHSDDIDGPLPRADHPPGALPRAIHPRGALPRATGIETLPQRGGAPLRASAAREVILCAGAIGTPQILQLSGVGPAGLLRRHGIPLVHDSPGVGENLQDHLQIRAVFGVEGVKTLNTQAGSWWGKARIALEYLLWRSGPMSMAPSQLGAFTRSSAEHAWPNLEFHVQPLSLDAFGEPLHRFNAITASVCNLHPSSRGSVQIASARPQDAPRIRPNYLSTAEDRQVAIDSLRLTRRIAAMPALAHCRPRELRPGPEFQTDDQLARLAGDIGTTIFHPAGSCCMGRDDDPAAVVDSRLRVRGVAGLRIVDASVMPRLPSGNINAPTLMIAERAAGWILAGKP